MFSFLFRRFASPGLDLAPTPSGPWSAREEPDGASRSPSNFLLFQRRDSFAHSAITEPTADPEHPRTRACTCVHVYLHAWKQPRTGDPVSRKTAKGRPRPRPKETRRDGRDEDAPSGTRNAKRGPPTIRLEKKLPRVIPDPSAPLFLPTHRHPREATESPRRTFSSRRNSRAPRPLESRPGARRPSETLSASLGCIRFRIGRDLVRGVDERRGTSICKCVNA